MRTKVFKTELDYLKWESCEGNCIYAITDYTEDGSIGEFICDMLEPDFVHLSDERIGLISYEGYYQLLRPLTKEQKEFLKETFGIQIIISDVDLSVLHSEIKNIGDFYTDEEILVVLKHMGKTIIIDTIADDFVNAEWERPIRRCSHCGNLMTAGYLLCDEYACSDECRNEIYKKNEGVTTDEDAYRLYLRDCYNLSEKEIEGKTSKEIEEEHEDDDVSDEVMYTEWL